MEDQIRRRMEFYRQAGSLVNGQALSARLSSVERIAYLVNKKFYAGRV